MATIVEQLSDLVPVQVKDEDKIKYSAVGVQEYRGRFQFFRVAPELEEGRQRKVEVLAQSDIASAIVHIIKSGGENALHAHRGQDATWLVLEGQITFYGEDGEPIAVLNARDGLFVPRGAAYYFMSTGTDTAIILRMSAKATDVPNERLDYDTPFLDHAGAV
jgi:mannose-6-phosphate isomerase-like protein (cupin superfamily)